MITYVSYGVTKSASTFAYQLTEELIRNAGYRPRKLAAHHNYTDPIHENAVNAVRVEAGSRPVVIKTHGAPDSKVLELVGNGAIFASAILRDPRDVALSMLDHGARCRRSNKPGFEDIYSLDDVFPNLDDQFDRLKAWMSCANVLPLTYDEICFSTESVVEKIANQLNLGVNAADILRRFRRKSVIGHFNKGIKDRHVFEMSWEDQARIIERYRNIYSDYLDMSDVIPCVFRGEASAPKGRYNLPSEPQQAVVSISR